MHDALVHGAVAEEGDGDAAVAPNLAGQGHARGVGHLRADDAVGAHEAQARVDEVHGTALALGEAVGLAQHLGDGALGVHAPGQRVVMAAIGAGEIVAGLQGRGHAQRIGFVADGGVHGAADLARFGQFQQRLFHPADQVHGAVHLLQLFNRQPDRFFERRGLRRC